MEQDELETIKEVAKATGTSVEAFKQLGGFLAQVFGPAFKEFGGIVSDWAYYIRFKNAIMIQDKWDAIIKRRKIEGKTVPIPSRYAIPLIQNASEEDNETIQNMWAGLIANWTDPGKKFSPRKLFIQILSSLEPLDANILQFFPTQGWKVFREVSGGGITLSILQTKLKATEEEIRISLQNLARLGCVMAKQEHVMHFGVTPPIAFGELVNDPRATFRLSPLGSELLKACQGAESAEF